MATMEQTAEQTAEYYGDLDALLERVVSGDTSTEVGLTRRLADIAEKHYVQYGGEQGVRIHFSLRFQLHRKEGKYTDEQVSRISPRVHSFLGLNGESASA